jgi:hypothetical protein
MYQLLNSATAGQVLVSPAELSAAFQRRGRNNREPASRVTVAVWRPSTMVPLFVKHLLGLRDPLVRRLNERRLVFFFFRNSFILSLQKLSQRKATCASDALVWSCRLKICSGQRDFVISWDMHPFRDQAALAKRFSASA